MDQEALLTTIDQVVVAAYFLLIISAGFILRRLAARGLTDYFLAGRRVPWWVLGMSGTASNFDMTGTMVVISFVYAIGLQGVWVSMRGGMCLPLGILMVFMGKWLRRSKVMTNAEWMELRFGSGRDGHVARLLSALSNLVVTLAMLVYFVKGTGKFLAVFLPFSPDTCALLMLGVGLLYTTLSGLYGVIYTDVLQEVLMLAASLFVGYYAFVLPDHSATLAYAGPDWNSFLPRWQAEPMDWLHDPTMYQFFGLCIIFWMARGIFEGFGGFTGGYMTQRYFAARNSREASLLTAQWILLLLFRWALIVGVALLALALARQQADVAAELGRDPERTLPVVIGHVIPAGLRGLMVAGLIAAAMSTLDSTLNAGAAYWVRDIYQRYLRPEATKAQLLRQSYVATIGLAVVSVALALGIRNINEIWGWITGPLSAGLFAPVILRWYWARFNGYGFALSTAAGLVAAVAQKAFWPTLPLYYSFPLVWLLSLAVGVVGALATPATSPEVLAAFWQRVRPFGWWRQVTASQPTAAGRRFAGQSFENIRDSLVWLLAVAWHLTGVAVVVALLLHRWSALVVSGLLWLSWTVLLYGLWYRYLDTNER
jgi:SSS family transporter